MAGTPTAAEMMPPAASVGGEPEGPPASSEDTPGVIVGPGDKPRRRRRAFLLLFLLGLLATLITIAIWYLIFRQPITVPLPVIPESKLPAYSTSVYGVQRPTGIAVTSSGDRIYVTQSAGDRVAVVLDSGGNKVGTMAPPEGSAGDHSPVYIAADPLTNELYVSDRLTGTIYIYDRDGVYQREFALAVARPGWQPLGLAFDKAGNLYVTDLSGPYQKVLVIDRTAKVVRTLGENDKLNFPNGIGVDGDGDVYVTDSDNGRLLVYDASNALIAQVGRGAGTGNLGLPRGLAIDGSGRVFVADATAHGVFVYRAPNKDTHRLDYVGLMGGQGVADGLFQYPNSVAIDARGRVYVADTFNDRVQIWSY